MYKRQDEKKKERVKSMRDAAKKKVDGIKQKYFGMSIELMYEQMCIRDRGGSVRDDHVIDTCNKYGMVMSFTGLPVLLFAFSLYWST